MKQLVNFSPSSSFLTSFKMLFTLYFLRQHFLNSCPKIRLAFFALPTVKIFFFFESYYFCVLSQILLVVLVYSNVISLSLKKFALSGSHIIIKLFTSFYVWGMDHVARGLSSLCISWLTSLGLWGSVSAHLPAAEKRGGPKAVLWDFLSRESPGKAKPAKLLTPKAGWFLHLVTPTVTFSRQRI